MSQCYFKSKSVGLMDNIRKPGRISYLFILAFAVTAFTGCASKGGDKPAELVKFDEEVNLKKIWSVNVGKGQGDKYNRLSPVLAGDVIYAASNNGVVLAINNETGRNVWKVKLKYKITGGVGVGEDKVLLGTESSQVVALDQSTGKVLWESSASSEILSAPVAANDIVVVQSVDGKLTGLNAQTGEQVWIYESIVPDLSLRGTSTPIISQGFVIAGFGNGTIVSLALDNGTLRWEERVAIPSGRSEIDRLVDIDGALYVNESGQLLVPSYQGYLAAIDVVTGQTRWRVKESSTVSAGSGFGNIYISNDSGNVVAYKIGQEESIWNNDQLSLRQLSSPTGFNNYVAVADYEGYVHLLSQIDGHFMSRIKVDGKGARTNILSQNNTLYVYGNSGDLVALRVEQ